MRPFYLQQSTSFYNWFSTKQVQKPAYRCDRRDRRRIWGHGQDNLFLESASLLNEIYVCDQIRMKSGDSKRNRLITDDWSNITITAAFWDFFSRLKKNKPRQPTTRPTDRPRDMRVHSKVTSPKKTGMLQNFSQIDIESRLWMGYWTMGPRNNPTTPTKLSTIISIIWF